MGNHPMIVTAEPGKQELTITREFDAPRALVFDAFINPNAIPQWWGPRELTTTVDVLEPRFGGRWRFVQHDAQGNEYAFRGAYHAVNAPEEILYTFEFEGLPGHVLMESIRFHEHAGKTKITEHVVFQSVADRDGMIESGMERGASESMERLDELLKPA